MQIAIIGAGFSGLAVTWHLLKDHPTYKVTVFDAVGVGGGASGIAAGLLHPYAGARGKLNWLGVQGMESTRALLEVAAQALGQPVAEYSGLLRLAVTEMQLEDFARCAATYPTVSWQIEGENRIPGLALHPAIFIPEAITVNSSLYLQGLKVACERLGANFEQAHITSLEALGEFDAIVVATGAAAKGFSELAHLPITPVKGQVLRFSWPEDRARLPYAVNSHAYLVMDPNSRGCLAGATFEREYRSEGPDLEAACADLVPKITLILPDFRRETILECRAGIRASTPDHHPIARRVFGNCWVLTGMGSKGLLYHSLFGQKVAQDIALG